jgi:hypothetical protein
MKLTLIGWAWLVSLAVKAGLDIYLIGKPRWSKGWRRVGGWETLGVTVLGYLFFFAVYTYGVRT